MEKNEMKKIRSSISIEIIEYIPQAMVSKTIIEKTTGNINVISFADGEGLAEKKSPHDSFIQIIDGRAELVIDGNLHMLETGYSIIIPANTFYYIKPNEQFKMIATIIKSAYE
ncbi:cupin domain-containing protein [Panacibacter sp. KCS-6]|uniref:Cupin domain-containing protein n=2 Tax=Limnovirga soli TaxID=2656915 RepID=A0A8J8FDM7_9BACT|nr:cupin domain-containing protein [Limnovirga soli]